MDTTRSARVACYVLTAAAITVGGFYAVLNLLAGGALVGAGVVSLALLGTGPGADSTARAVCAPLAVLGLVGGAVGLGVNTPDPVPVAMGGGAVLCGASLVALAILTRDETKRRETKLNDW